MAMAIREARKVDGIILYKYKCSSCGEYVTHIFDSPGSAISSFTRISCGEDVTHISNSLSADRGTAWRPSADSSRGSTVRRKTDFFFLQYSVLGVKLI